MLLFDIVREINDKISFIANRGLPGKRTPYLTAVTDGYDVEIMFMGQVIWKSVEWEFHYADEDKLTDGMIKEESKRVREHLITESQKMINQFYHIQLD